MIKVDVTCDIPGCEEGFSVGFDSEADSYGDILSGLMRMGWSLKKPSANSRQHLFACKNHSVEDAANKFAEKEES